MTQAEFVNEWKDELLGIACYGYAVDACDGPLAKAEQGSHVRRSVDKTNKILARMWQSMQPKPEPIPAKIEPPVRPTTAPAGPAGPPPPQGRR